MERGYKIVDISRMNGYASSAKTPTLRLLVNVVDDFIDKNPSVTFDDSDFALFVSRSFYLDFQKENEAGLDSLNTLIGKLKVNFVKMQNQHGQGVWIGRDFDMKNKRTGSSIDTVREKRVFERLQESHLIPLPWEVSRLIGAKKIELSGTQAALNVPETDFGTTEEWRAAINYLADQFGGTVKWD